MRIVIICVLVGLLGGCREVPQGVEDALVLSGSNKGELKKVLRHYGWRQRDSLKYRAACFLIGNMKWHFSARKVDGIDPQFERFCEYADSVFYAGWQETGGCLDSLQAYGRSLKQTYAWLKDSIHRYVFQPSRVEWGNVVDLQAMKSNFLITHIDNAFEVWEQSPFAKHLSFQEFCEYVLPYRPARSYPFLYSGAELRRRFEKYVNADTAASLKKRISAYQNRVVEMRYILGDAPQKDIGIYNLFFHGHECLDHAAYGCAVLRACGIPVMIEFCDAYRDFAGRHFYCVTLDSNRRWQTFNPESSLPGEGGWVLGVPMNLYRQYYAPQPGTPYYLRREGEYLPPLFASPCMRDVTAERAEVCRLTLPFPHKISNRLAYLVAFQARRKMSPVTWGVIDTVHQEVTFENALFGRLYFPAYYAGKELRFFGEPFYVEKDTACAEGYRVQYFHKDTANRGTVVLTRKFPRKSNMIKVAEDLVGATFVGANRRDFADARLIYQITAAPGPYLQDFIIPRPGAYQFYRFEASDEHPHANVAMLEFITSRRWGYSNVLPPTPAAVLSPKDTLLEQADSGRVKLLDAPSWDDMKWKAEYDGNMQTAPGAYKTVTLWLQQPQVVERIRFAPWNADNGIKRGHRYELWYWDDEWLSCGEQVARYEYLEYKNIPEGALMWLRNHTTGKEELPFLFKDGKQLFLYYDMIK